MRVDGLLRLGSRVLRQPLRRRLDDDLGMGHQVLRRRVVVVGLRRLPGVVSVTDEALGPRMRFLQYLLRLLGGQLT